MLKYKHSKKTKIKMSNNHADVKGSRNPSWKGGKIIKKCLTCNKKFSFHPSSNRKFCSKKCHTKWQKGKHLSPDTEFKKGMKLTKKQCITISERLKGKPTWNKGRKMTDYPQCGWQKNSIANKGKSNPMWNGGKRKTVHGYIIIYKPNHPFCNITKCVLEHRLIAEKMLNRYLIKTEVIHHINEIKNDNRPENLYLFSIANEHNSYHRNLKNNKIQQIVKSNLV